MILQPCNTLKVHKRVSCAQKTSKASLWQTTWPEYLESHSVSGKKPHHGCRSHHIHRSLRPSSDIPNIQSHSPTFHLVWLRLFSKQYLHKSLCANAICAKFWPTPDRPESFLPCPILRQTICNLGSNWTSSNNIYEMGTFATSRDRSRA